MNAQDDAQSRPDILLVEDLEADAKLAQRALKKTGLIHSLTWLDDGEQALDFLLARRAYAQRDTKLQPKLILLDLKLPKISGLEVLESLRQDARTHLVPVAVMTSSREPSDIRRAYEKGANSFLVKPVDYKAYTQLLCTVATYWLTANELP